MMLSAASSFCGARDRAYTHAAAVVGGVAAPLRRAAPAARSIEASPKDALDQLAARARGTAERLPVDVALQLAAANDAVEAQRQVRRFAASGSATPWWRRQAPQLVQAAITAYVLKDLLRDGGWTGRAALLSAGHYLPDWTRAFDGAAVPTENERERLVRLAEAEQAYHAQCTLRASMVAAREHLGAPARPARPPAARLAAASPLGEVAWATEALAQRLDDQRRRCHHVAARLRSYAAKAAASGADPELTAHARLQARGGRACKAAGVALALSFAVGYLAPFASLIGFVLSTLVLVVAGAVLAYNLRAAVRYLGGEGSPNQVRAEMQRARDHAAGALAQRRAAELTASWRQLQNDERTLASLREQLAALIPKD